MRCGIACGLLLSLLLFLAPSTNAQDVPGNVFLGVPSILTHYVLVCLPPEGGVYALATEPLEPVKSVRFQVTWPDGVDHDQGSVIWPGAVDVSEPGDDIWDIVFEECRDKPGSTLYLVNYGGVDYHGQRGWMCPYGDVVPDRCGRCVPGKPSKPRSSTWALPGWMAVLLLETTTARSSPPRRRAGAP